MNQRIFSFNRSFFVVLQPDGVVALYAAATNQLLWSAGASPAPPSPPYTLQVYDDGNLAVCDAVGQWRWASNGRAAYPAPPSRLLVGDDGSLVVLNAANAKTWGSADAPAPAPAPAPTAPSQVR